MVSIKNREIKHFFYKGDLFEFAAKDFASRSIEAVNKKGLFRVALSGGNTPKSFFDTLINTDRNIPWNNIHFFFGDERYVPADNVNSNYHSAYEHLFSKVPVTPQHIYRIPTECKTPKETALAYEKLLRKAFNLENDAIPEFDLIYLGLGDNAHTASLMPFSAVVKNYVEEPIASKNSKQIVIELFDTVSKLERITMTPNIINESQAIIFLVTGLDKAPAVWEVLEGPSDPINFPAQLINSHHGKTIWYLDKDAASNLKHSQE